MAGLQDLAFWLHLRAPRAEPALPDAVVPPGDGPLVLMCGAASGLRGLARQLRRARRDLRLGALGPVAVDRGDRPVVPVLPEPPADPAAARELVARLAPAAVVLTDGALPAALIAACDEAGVPVTLIADRAQLAASAARTTWRGGRRAPVTRVARLLVPDAAARSAALREGVAPARIELIGTPTPVMAPLSCNSREHAALGALIRNRHVWLAASLPFAEAGAVIAAHAALLAAHHRALLIVAPADPADAAPIAAAAEAAGLVVARREQDDEPGPDMQVLVAEDGAELGLWYRLAPVTLAGGTLSPGGPPPRHPFEPAAHGTAIIHGPCLPVDAEAWRALDMAGAARAVGSAAGLALAVEELSAPERAARLAHAAWQVSTAGAEVVRRITEQVLSDLPQGRG